MEETIRHILFFIFNPSEEKLCAGGHHTHLFLNPDDVKGFPFKLQLADINPAESHYNSKNISKK